MSSLPSPAERPLAGLREVLAPLGRRFTTAGHDLYLVGGVVRDAAMGLATSPDVDLTTDADPGTILELVTPLADDLWRQGERFGTIGLRSARLGGFDLEITTYRAEHYDPASRKPTVHFGSDILTDLERRDFTINAMAVAVVDGALVDPFGGWRDLERRLLRTPGEAAESFADDPLRLLRAARFLARFGLTVDDPLAAAADDHRHRLGIVSIERIRAELERLLEVPDPTAGLLFLRRHRLLDRIRPAGDLPDEIVRRITASADPLVRRAALWSDYSAEELAGHLRDLRFSSAEQRRTATLVGGARRLLELDPDDDRLDAVLRRIVHRLGDEPEGTDRVVALAEALRPTSGPGLARRLTHLRQVEDLTDLTPPVQGGELIAELGLTPGPQVGRIVAALFELRLDEGPRDRAGWLDAARRLAG